MNNQFVWADLSTFDIQATKRFYRQCFQWKYSSLGDGYLLAQIRQESAAGLYTMPAKFQSIGMPSFWMSYIHVQDLEQVVRMAEKWGGRVELQPQPFAGGGRIALIRDPLGAGFTCYEGREFETPEKGVPYGRVVWHELHISALDKVQAFYTNVFGWTIQPSGHADRYEIFGLLGELIAGIQVTSNDIKGDKEYWGVYFAVESLSHSAKQIERSGGLVAMKQPLGNLPSLLAYDPQGAAFYLVEKAQKDESSPSPSNSSFKWRALLGLVFVAIATLFELNWVWGAFFLFWVMPDLKARSTHFLEYVAKDENPVIYWLIMGTWIFLSLYLLLSGFIGP